MIDQEDLSNKTEQELNDLIEYYKEEIKKCREEIEDYTRLLEEKNIHYTESIDYQNNITAYRNKLSQCEYIIEEITSLLNKEPIKNKALA